MNIQLALRLLECGLDMPKNEPSKTFGGVPFIAIPAVKTKLLVGMNWRSPRGILYTVVATNDGPRLLPDTSDFALLGWVVAEVERVSQKQVGVYQSSDCPTWWACMGFADAEQCFEGTSRLEALTAAWEAALKAAE